MSDSNNDSTRTSAVRSPPGIVSRIRTYFLTGLVVAGPVAVTLWLIWWFVTWVDGLVRPFIPGAYRPETYLPVRIPGLGLIIAFVALTLLGFLTANLIGRKLVDFGEGILSRMPIVRPIYRTAKQIFETLFSKSESSFRRVGLVEFPSPGMWSLVFLTQSPTEQIAGRLPASEYVSAFMPCTPNPTTGFFFYVPKGDVIELDITVEQAMTVIMSAGIVQPTTAPPAPSQLAALAETARAAQAARKVEPTVVK
ncbi:MAG TPA: DUF502 domain-containing protein [Xanthobacteraceae bacterium]|jgi:uncharacterized membrane protein|nr:DUF502 domain-containing protein [Xanthobacteraceae bacterium]